VLLGEGDDLVRPSTGSLVPGTSGALALTLAMWRAFTLSPSESDRLGGGPIHISPASMTFCAKGPFSARKP
jgi:hypothetical protein